MKFFTSSEIHKNVGLKLTKAQNLVEEKINELINNKNYGNISYWGFISIANPEEVYAAGFFKEVKKYKKTKNEVEFRLRINYEELLNGNDKDVFGLICQSILRSIDIAEFDLKIKNFDFDSFRNDLKSLFKEEQWI